MKRIGLYLLTLMMLLSLCACGKGDVYDVYLDEGIFTVDTVNETITHEGISYPYDLREYGSGVMIDLTYPDGSTYTWTRTMNIGYGGGSDDYDENRYIDADILLDVLEEETSVRREDRSGKFILLGLIAVPIGLFYFFAPKTVWWLEHCWWVKDGEPTDFALAMTKFGGIILILVGLISLIYPIFT